MKYRVSATISIITVDSCIVEADSPEEAEEEARVRLANDYRVSTHDIYDFDVEEGK